MTDSAPQSHPDDDGIPGLAEDAPSKPATGKGTPTTERVSNVSAALPEDTAPLPPDAALDITSRHAEDALQEVAKAGTNFDTIVGRLVVDQGLATPEEVEHCLALARDNRDVVDRSGQSLAQLLVNREYVTKRQIARLRQIIEAERSGQKIPGYQITGKLGAGAMATVYRAKQISLDREVAIKILPRKFSGNPQFIERFYAEGRAAAQLNHPNIVQAYDVGKAGEYHYFVMEYVDGRTVHVDIDKQGRLREADAIAIIIQVAEALGHAHKQGLVHRDVKPKNIMLTGHGKTSDSIAKLADMGLARVISDEETAQAERGKAFGTPYYISPEQIRGETSIGPPTDIYSLGATMYHMLTGSVPFDGKNPSEVMRKHLKGTLVPPDHVNPKLSAGVSVIMETMMAKKVSDRYQNCNDLIEDLRAVAAGKPPPFAQREDLALAAVKQLQAIESDAPTEIAEDSTLVSGGLASLFREPLVIILLLLLVLSIVLNVASLAGVV